MNQNLKGGNPLKLCCTSNKMLQMLPVGSIHRQYHLMVNSYPGIQYSDTLYDKGNLRFLLWEFSEIVKNKRNQFYNRCLKKAFKLNTSLT
jgi:hypothetical protein